MKTLRSLNFVVVKYTKNLTCNGVDRSNPRYDSLYRCDQYIDDFNTRFDSGDTYVIFVNCFKYERYMNMNNIMTKFYVSFANF